MLIFAVDCAQARLHALQVDPATYCDEPMDIPDFHRWLENFNVDEQKGEISELLVSNPDVRAIYTQVVSMPVRLQIIY